MTKISAILLAAGLSSRMKGPNKLLLVLGEQTLIEHAYSQLIESDAGEVIVVTGRDQDQINALLKLRPQDKFIHNPDFSLGMTTSIQKGVETALGNAYMICLADMPMLKADHYNGLIERYKASLLSNDMSILTPVVSSKRGNPVIFSRSYREAILAHREMDGCRKLIKSNLNHLTEYITDELAYISDLDTLEDYHQLRQ